MRSAARNVLLIAFFAVTVGYGKTAPKPAVAPKGGGTPACKIEGDPTRWAIAYCLYVAETDDMESVLGTPCVNDASKRNEKFKNVCDANAYWKAEVCAYLAKHRLADQWKGDAKKCAADTSFYPTGVKEGF